jgi:16S rRNA (uracil1498-N3)-methyltransferase
MTHVFWSASVALGSLVVGGPEGRHAADVRRVRVGELIELVDGQGLRGAARVTAVGKGQVTVSVTSVTQELAPQPSVVVAQGLAKGERAELAVELCSEVGVDTVLPWEAARSISRWSGDKAVKGRDRWTSVARESGKQARRARFLAVGDLVSTDALLDRVAGAALAVVLEATAAVPLGGLAVPVDGEVLLVVGPEGGLDPVELERLVTAGAVCARLGPSVLRTSGAGAVAAAVLLAQTARWRAPLA